MLKADKLLVTTSSLFNTDIVLNNAVSQDYNIKFAGRPLTSIGKNISLIAQDAQVGGTNLNGGSIIVSGGISTGTGSSSILFKTSKGGSTGTTDNTPTTKLTITGTGVFPVFLSASVNPTTSDIPAGTSSVFKNTTTGDLEVWVNDAGTIKTLTPPPSNSSNDYWLSAKITYTAAGDGIADDAAKLTTAFSTSNTIVYLPVGAYKLNSTISISNVSNLKIIGAKNSKMTSSTLKTLLSLTNCTNVEIVNVIFESTVNDAGSTADVTNGLLKVNGAVGLDVTTCTFNAPTAITDGIKMTADSTHLISALRIEGCSFNGIGQRGIEITAANYTSQYFTNAKFFKNTFNNTGSKVTSAGHAILIRAYSELVSIFDNHITDANSIAIETDGIYSLIIQSNNITSVTRAFSPFSIRNLNSGKTTTGLSVTNNVVDVRDTEDHTIWFERITEFSICDNFLRAGQVVLMGSKGLISGNNILSDDDRALYMETPSSDNYCTGNVFDNSLNSAALEPVFTDGAGVNNNLFINNQYRTQSGNNPYRFSSGATANSFNNSWE